MAATSLPPDPRPGDARSMRERMLAGDLYHASDRELVRMTRRAQALCARYNATEPDADGARRDLLDDLFGALGPGADIRPPFFCDYGAHITAGHTLFMNVGCVVLDCGRVTLGDRVFMGPGVQIYTASHPLDASLRGQGWEDAHPVTLGDDVWIGGAAILCPGVTVGARAVIGAGSVVTKDIPPGVVAVGNPCRVVREVGGADPRRA